jgi:2-oxoacid:acceptor oxidoreductase delta subunit (pyruvate/2-ketoisovalerate family)
MDDRQGGDKVKAKAQKTQKGKGKQVKSAKAKGMARSSKPSVKKAVVKAPARRVVVPEDIFGTINVPEDRAVPFGAITPAPVKQQDLFMTSNWRIVRPVIDHEKCTRCFTCYIACPDSCWSFNEKEEKMEWNWKFCKGCQICITECPADALKAVPELDFEDGVVRLEKPF